MSNGPITALSPYLLQHADGPVDWWPWSAEAFAEAKRRDVPILLSVGYAACHWCQVMARESFEDGEVAAVMNEHFVNVKVDREERPDIDAIYLAATQAMIGGSGWPLTCFLTPDGEPFHCGTYYPPQPRPGVPGFAQLLDAVVRAWRDERADVCSAGVRVVAHLAEQSTLLVDAAVTAQTLDQAVAALSGEFDFATGGFGDAPKFPPAMLLEFLLRHHERTGSADALAMVNACAEAMARGGIYDQLAGGFARYAVDAEWVVPHFEKMLYDNALLLRCYAHLARRTSSDLARRVAEETAGFLLGEMRTAEGAFAVSLAAHADGVEGLTYVWTPEQMREVLGEADGAWAQEVLGVGDEDTFEAGTSTLRLLADPDDTERWQRVRAEMLAAREIRPQPARDDKVIAEWNGLAITALAEAGAAFGNEEWIEAAEQAARFVLTTHLVDGRLRRSSRAGHVGEPGGVLADYACLAESLLALHQATGNGVWLSAATGLLDTAVARFADPASPGRYFDTPDDAEALVHRPADPSDNDSPSGASALAAALLTASALAGPEHAARYRATCERALERSGILLNAMPWLAGNWLAVAEAVQSGPVQVAVVGADDGQRARLYSAAEQAAPGGAVLLAGTPDAPGVPLLTERRLIDGGPAAYICRGYLCERSATSAEDVAAALLG